MSTKSSWWKDGTLTQGSLDEVLTLSHLCACNRQPDSLNKPLFRSRYEVGVLYTSGLLCRSLFLRAVARGALHSSLPVTPLYSYFTLFSLPIRAKYRSLPRLCIHSNNSNACSGLRLRYLGTAAADGLSLRVCFLSHLLHGEWGRRRVT